MKRSQSIAGRLGDTLSEIAAALGVTLEAIIEANDIKDPDLIHKRQVLVMPNSGEK